MNSSTVLIFFFHTVQIYFLFHFYQKEHMNIELLIAVSPNC